VHTNECTCNCFGAANHIWTAFDNNVTSTATTIM
jgi:hypothetical protein